MKYTFVMARVESHFQYLQDLGYDVVCTCLQGSQNYNLDEYSEEYTSDVDTKSIIMPSLEDFVKGKSPISTIEEMENGEHAEVKDIRVMFEMFKKMNISYIELLYSDYIVINPKWKDLILPLFQERELISGHFRNQFIRCIVGMAYEKQKALCHPYPNIKDKIDKYGYDGKQLSHCFRLLDFLEKYKSGLPLAACYKVDEPRKTVMMNFKKQKTWDGKDILPVETAIEYCDKIVEQIKQLRDEMIGAEIIHKEARTFLDELQYKMIKEKLRREIVEDNE